MVAFEEKLKGIITPIYDGGKPKTFLVERESYIDNSRALLLCLYEEGKKYNKDTPTSSDVFSDFKFLNVFLSEFEKQTAGKESERFAFDYDFTSGNMPNPSGTIGNLFIGRTPENDQLAVEYKIHSYGRDIKKKIRFTVYNQDKSIKALLVNVLSSDEVKRANEYGFDSDYSLDTCLNPHIIARVENRLNVHYNDWEFSGDVNHPAILSMRENFAIKKNKTLKSSRIGKLIDIINSGL